MRRQPGRLIFIDETSVKTNMTPLRGRSLRGERLMADAPFGRWQTQTFVAGLRCHELVAPWIIEGAMDGHTFDTYARTQLAPCLGRGDVVILDNLNVHKSPRAAQALIKAMGCTPDFDVERVVGINAKLGHRPSILQDLMAGRSMEIDALYSVPLELAKSD